MEIISLVLLGFFCCIIVTTFVIMGFIVTRCLFRYFKIVRAENKARKRRSRFRVIK